MLESSPLLFLHANFKVETKKSYTVKQYINLCDGGKWQSSKFTTKKDHTRTPKKLNYPFLNCQIVGENTYQKRLKHNNV